MFCTHGEDMEDEMVWMDLELNDDMEFLLLSVFYLSSEYFNSP